MPGELLIIGWLVLLLGVPGIVLIVWTVRGMRRFDRYIEDRLAGVASPRRGNRRQPRQSRADARATWSVAAAKPDLAELAKNIAQSRLLVGRQHTGRSRYVVAAATVDEMTKRNPLPPVDLVVATWLAAVQDRRPLDESVYEALGFSPHSLKIVTALTRDSFTSSMAVGHADVETILPPASFDPELLHVWQARYIATAGKPVRERESASMSALGRDGELAFESFD